MSVKPTRVNMLILMQPDIEKAVSFYEKMGFQRIFHIKGKWAEFQLADIKIGLAPIAQELPLHRTGIVLEVKNLQETYDQFKKDGVEFVREPVEALHGLMASFRDPGNSVIDLYQPTPEKVAEFMKQQKLREQEELAKKADA
jgi:predicted enzyme related to lactoylglutathione lyase